MTGRWRCVAACIARRWSRRTAGAAISVRLNVANSAAGRHGPL